MFNTGNLIATETDEIHFDFNIRKKVSEKQPPATRVNKSLKEISSCNFRFDSLLAPFRAILWSANEISRQGLAANGAQLT